MPIARNNYPEALKEMARVNIYLDDDLHEMVKESGIPISTICQDALRKAISPEARIKTINVEIGRLMTELDSIQGKG